MQPTHDEHPTLTEKDHASTKTKVLGQLWYEGRWPLALSLAWTLYSAHATPGDGWTLRNLISTFGPAFFLVVWFFSQWHRVKKQQSVEEGLSEIQAQIRGMLSDLEVKTKHLTGFITGGDSMCYLSSVPDSDGRLAPLIVMHVGQYPLYDVSMRLVDLGVFDQLMAAGRTDFDKAEVVHGIGDLIPGHVKVVPAMYFMGTGDVRKFNVFYTARNGAFVQRLRFRRVDGSWLRATKVDGLHAHFEEVQDGYPRNEAGEVDWA